MDDAFQVIPFDNLEEAAAYMQANEEAANANLTDEQRAIVWGDYFCRIVAFGDHALAIFGEIRPLEEIERVERELGTDDEEWEYTRKTMLNSYERGYRFSKCYSVVEPDGELGDVHISTMHKITPEQFAQARTHDWDGGWLFQHEAWFQEAVS